MSLALRLIFMFCIFAGMANAVVHQNLHFADDECAHAHEHHGENSHTQHDHGDHDEDHDKTPHHHNCCHAPNADRALTGAVSIGNFQGLLVEILYEDSLFPDQPFYALDKPPLI